MDKIEQRLHDSSKNCFECYEAWAKDKKNVDAREKLQESVHELRRVASRLEIELAISERDEMTQKPIPIPPHRDANRKSRKDDNIGNKAEGAEGKPQAKKKPVRKGKPQGKKAAEG